MRPLILVGRPNHTRKTEEIRRSEAFMAKDEGVSAIELLTTEEILQMVDKKISDRSRQRKWLGYNPMRGIPF